MGSNPLSEDNFHFHHCLINLKKMKINQKRNKTKLAVVKSNLLKQIADQYPNYLKKDLNKFLEILLKEIMNSLRKGERVEFRDWGIFYTNIQHERISRNPNTV